VKLTIEALGHRFTLSLEGQDAGQGTPDREGSADALVERADPYLPPIGFGPGHIREDRAR
jgi:hypothetical protein